MGRPTTGEVGGIGGIDVEEGNGIREVGVDGWEM